MIEAGIGQCETQGIFPVNAATHRIGGLVV
jgi:hypothetical protein